MRFGTWRDLVRAAIIGAGAIAASGQVLVSLDRSTYFYYRATDRLGWQHPTVGVAVFVLLTAIETAMAFWAVVPGRATPVWSRSLIVCGLLVPWALMLSVAIMHSPGFYMLHVLWVWTLLLAVGAAAVVAGGVRVFARIGRMASRPTNA